MPLLVSALLLAVGVAFVGLWTGTPGDCTAIGPAAWQWTPDGVVVAVDAACAGGADELRSGDLVTAVDGRRVTDATGSPDWQVGATFEYSVVRDETQVSAPVPLRDPSLANRLIPAWSTLLFVVSLLGIAAYVASRRLDASTGALLVLGSGLAASTLPTLLGLSVVGVLAEPIRWLFVIGTQLVYVTGWAGLLTFVLLFPQPYGRSEHWSRWLRWGVYTAPVWVLAGWAAVAVAASTNVVEWFGRVIVGTSLVTIVTLLTVITIGVQRLRQPSDAVQRQQVRWLVGGGALGAAAGLSGWFLPELLVGEGLPTQLIGLTGLPFVIGLTVALLRYRLFDLEVVLNRGLVYGFLTAGVVTMYFGVVAVVAGLLRDDTVAPAAIVATAVVAVAVNPLRLVLQRTVDRLMYGDRDDPYSALSRLGRRLDVASDPAGLLGSVADDVADALRVPYVRIEVADRRASAGRQPRWLQDADGLRDVALTDGDEHIGRLLIAPRAPGAGFSRADRRLIDDLARRVSAAARELTLRDDLQRSRERLVLTREEERRALRRALHDEFGPVLAGLSLRTEAARRMVQADPARATDELGAVRADAEGLVADIRKLAYDLRPPALDELGLTEALRHHARTVEPLAVTVDDGAGLPELPAAVEAAAYRIAVEAVTNVARHAQATQCRVQLTMTDGSLALDVTDDGRGLPGDFTAGVGISAMRERAAELGGSCRVERGNDVGAAVHATLPVRGSRT